MFEKSLYDLIRGLRHHKGNEKEFIAKTLKECRNEVRSQDMDVKATALLKLIYLEMLGHDMSWASFHVLEVMSSAKYHQKRVGYLGAVQSFRPDTEVLMLATNLLKKDLGGTAPTVISLPIATLPHVITPSLALSTLQDLLPRLSHSHASVRKKTLVTLYRLALVYPEALRAAWPKIKERLMDPNEDTSVTAAIVNVVCELGWRRPNDFLPLAPRLFDLLVDGGNNWMAIKLIKLFATLTPHEPRLVRKLLPPLTNIMRTTPAMSLLYECINGIIQGGILGTADEGSATEEIAMLCVDKLRGMIIIEGDPNLKYVALLAFNKIVLTHPFLVSQQEDVILECIDSPDITIRIQALNLVQGMVTSQNLMTVVSRLLKQLNSTAPSPNSTPRAESDDETQIAVQVSQPDKQAVPLPEDYRVDVIDRILFMCSKENYANITDFDWYIDVLVQLVRLAPVPRGTDEDGKPSRGAAAGISQKTGHELRNVAVKVREMRGAVVHACDNILNQTINEPGQAVTSGAIKSVCWILGEYAVHISRPDDTRHALTQLLPRCSSPGLTTTIVQAIAKIFATTGEDKVDPWTVEKRAKVSLSMARMIEAFQPFILHPDLELQGCAVELTELLKLTSEATAAQDNDDNAPLLLIQALPSLYKDWELNSVAVGAQQRVPVPSHLDLDAQIHPDLNGLLSVASTAFPGGDDSDEFEAYYHNKVASETVSSQSVSAFETLQSSAEMRQSSYQQPEELAYDSNVVARLRAERNEKNKDDPFYIPTIGRDGTSTPIHNILRDNNGPDLDIDSIPIMKLDIEHLGSSSPTRAHQSTKPRHRVVVSADETLDGDDGASSKRAESRADASAGQAQRFKHSLLQVDSSHIGSFNINEAPAAAGQGDQTDDAEMRQAMKEVERLRLEMQRANERIHVAQGLDIEGTVVSKKKGKKKKKDGTTSVKSKKSKAGTTTEEVPGEESIPIAATGAEEILGADQGVEVAKPKKKKKKKALAVMDE